jgi:imidazoleglycerol-phosphate dehydratase
LEEPVATAKNPSTKKKPTSKRSSSARSSTVVRKTSETDIRVTLDLDNAATPSADTGVPFLDHMLDALGRHAFLGLAVKARGDIEIDDHHTVEDVGLALGQALAEALGDRKGIARFGHFEAPLDETLVAVTVDLSGRPYLVYNVKMARYQVGTFDTGLIEDFMQAFATAGGLNLHINLRYGRNPHHIAEATFKALAKALAQALQIDPRVLGVPSTKGTLTA